MIDDVLGVGHVGGHEEIEGGLIKDLHGKSGRGMIGREDRDAGLLLEPSEDGRQNGLEVRSGGNAQGVPGNLSVRSAAEGEDEGGDDGEEEQPAKFLRHVAP